MRQHERHAAGSELQQCIEACLACYQSCRQTSMNHCLETGGRHVEPDHFRLMSACAEICRTSADFMLIGTSLHKVVCGACADVCEACATSCADIGDMAACVDACRRCAESCRAMVASGPPRASQGSSHPGATRN